VQPCLPRWLLGLLRVSLTLQEFRLTADLSFLFERSGVSSAPVDLRRPLLIIREQASTTPIERFPDGKPLTYRWDPIANCLECDVPSFEHYEWSALRLGASLAAWNAGHLLLHAAGLCHKSGGAALALAESGGGKSTLSTLARSFDSLGDEVLLLRRESNVLYALATPFRSLSPTPASVPKAPIRAHLILHKSPVPHYHRALGHELLPAFMAQVFRPPKEVAPTTELMRRCALAINNIPAFHFHFPKSDAADSLLAEIFEKELLAKPSSP
jgi:hypothetical protein